MTTVFYGCGTMGSAILKAHLDQGGDQGACRAITARETSASALGERFGIQAGTDARALVDGADLIVLGMKPHQLTACLTEVADAVQPGTTVVSLAAGITCATIESLLPQAHVVRAMPNLGARIGQSATSLSQGLSARPEDMDRAQRLLAAAGSVTVVPEALINAVIGVAGSGPAWFLTVLEAVIDAGVAHGMTFTQATEMAATTMEATAALVRQEGIDPGVLRKQVCSPGGTTIAGVMALEANGVRAGVMAAVKAAHDRGIALQ